MEPKRKSGSYKTCPVDFADHFLLEIDRRSGEKPRYLTGKGFFLDSKWTVIVIADLWCCVLDENFLPYMRDLVIGGFDTISSVLEHVILRVCLQPAIQSKVQEETDQVIGATGPTYEPTVQVWYDSVHYTTLQRRVAKSWIFQHRHGCNFIFSACHTHKL